MVFLREAIRFGHCRRLCLRDSNRKGLVVDFHRPHCRRHRLLPTLQPMTAMQRLPSSAALSQAHASGLEAVIGLPAHLLETDVGNRAAGSATAGRRSSRRLFWIWRRSKEAAVAQGTKAYRQTTPAEGRAKSGRRLAVDPSAGAMTGRYRIDCPLNVQAARPTF